jgi:hypothetical protein
MSADDDMRQLERAVATNTSRLEGIKSLTEEVKLLRITILGNGHPEESLMWLVKNMCQDFKEHMAYHKECDVAAKKKAEDEAKTKQIKEQTASERRWEIFMEFLKYLIPLLVGAAITLGASYCVYQVP